MATTTENNRSPDIIYAGSALASSTTYYWRIKFSDDDKKEGAWSTATSTFSLSETETGGTPPELCNCATTTIYYIHTDHLSGSNAITNSLGEKTQVMDYLPFGAIRVNKLFGDFDEKRKFTGYEQDYSTGLNYAGARYQSPGEGRFLGQDPLFQDSPEQFIADPQQMNSYSYSRNNPLRYVDPKGEEIASFSAILATYSFIMFTYNALMNQIDTFNLETMETYPEQFSQKEIEQARREIEKNAWNTVMGSATGWANWVAGVVLDVTGVISDAANTASDYWKNPTLVNPANQTKNYSTPNQQYNNSGNISQQNTFSGGQTSQPSDAIPRSQNPTGYTSSGQPIYCWGACGDQ